jgi:hypothetical protein
MLFDVDHEGIPVHGSNDDEQVLIDGKVEAVWRTASHCHFNRDFRFNSQSTSMQCTPRKTIGGRAWLSIKLSSKAHEKALAAWGNTTLGLLFYWWHANKQQSGRGSIGKSALEGLPTLDVTALSPAKLKAASEIFDEFSSVPFQTFHKIQDDQERRRLDYEFATKVLGLPSSFCGTG